MAQGSAFAPLARILLAALLLVLPLGCRGQATRAGDAVVSVSIAPVPYTTGPAKITVTLSDAAGRPLSGAKVEIEGNMSHAGMVPVFAGAVETSPGTYVSRDFRFTMGGDWYIVVRVTPSSGEPFERTLDVRGVAGGPGHGKTGDGSIHK